ncbi:hypothetical protein [Shimia sp. R9_3]|uniref:hypothetical protein n=1 Tax=Shimia sp. R9_3 TaxID=2821113 RepID=UPI001ADA1C5F|nr:hypothetical protein [Shimia sp. R9_3]MBO9401784.1 hypothetical protein [Shimia sp. R9_3]
MRYLWFLLLANVLLLGCSPKAVNSLDQLTVSASNDGEFAWPANLNLPFQSRFLAINGQLPVPGPASSCFASSLRVANSFICLSPTGKSNIVERYYKSEADADDLIAIQDRLSKLQLNLAQLVLAEKNQVTALQTQAAQTLTTEAQNIAFEAKKSNVFIFRWASSGSAGGSGAFGSLFSANASAKNAQSGLVIVAGLRISQLMIGLNDFDGRFGNVPKGVKIATLTMSADDLLYFADSSLSAALGGSFDGELEDLLSKDQLSLQTQVALQAYAQVSAAQENQGLFRRPTVRPLTVEQAFAQSENSQVFFSTFTDIESLRKTLKK